MDYLHAFKYSKDAVSETAKFRELYKCWIEVYSDLESVGKTEVLDHAPTIKGFVTKLPSKAIGERYVAMTKDLKAKGKTDLSIVNEFMKAERQNQKELDELFGSKGSSKDPESRGLCFGCNQTGLSSHSVQINRLEDPRGTMALSRSLLSDVQPAGTNIQVPTPMGTCSTRIVCRCVKYFATSRSRKRPA